MEELKNHTLTSEQIESIFEFTSKKNVKFYDVQLELVDHVASKIEELMGADASLTFEVALQKVYKSYGVFGFTKVAETKFNELHKMWMRRMLSFLYSYITVPRIFFTILLTFLFYSVISYLPESNMEPMFLQMSSLAIGLVIVIAFGVVTKLNRGKSQYKLAVTDSYRTFSIGMIYWFYLPIYSLSFVSASPFFCILSSLIFAVSVILFYGFVFVFPTELERSVTETYAHLNLKEV